MPIAGSPGRRPCTGHPFGTRDQAVGWGRAPCHHGELLQGVFRDAAGRMCRALVTLPLDECGTRAAFRRLPGTAAQDLTVTPRGRHKALRAAELTRDLCAELRGHPADGGHLELRTGVPVGLGLGSSTSDIVAAIRAVAAVWAVDLAPVTVARLAVAAECASDPLMLCDRPVLFAQREGRVLEVLGEALPATLVLGCLTGGGVAVDTLALPAAEPGTEDVDAFDALRRDLRTAVVCRDVALLGRVCTESARRNQRVHRKGEFDLLRDIAGFAGAAGVQVAHSGNVAGLLFDPRVPDLTCRLRRCITALTGQGIAVTRVFSTGGAGSGAGQPRPRPAVWSTMAGTAMSQTSGGGTWWPVPGGGSGVAPGISRAGSSPRP